MHTQLGAGVYRHGVVHVALGWMRACTWGRRDWEKNRRDGVVLDVAMCDSLVVQVVDSRYELVEVESAGRFGHFPLRYPVKQIFA